MDANHILESLNEAQQQAIKSDAKQSLILAGAGSGKTRVITHKVAWLSSILDINPMSIMTVTFTNKAAREMRGRIEGILGEQLQTMWCGTFHGLFHRMLKMHWQEAGLINEYLEDDKLDKRVELFSQQVCDHTPEVLALTKETLYKQSAMKISDAYDFASKAMVENLQMPETKKGIDTFLNKN